MQHQTDIKAQAERGAAHLILFGFFFFGLLVLLGFLGYSSWQRQQANAGGTNAVGCRHITGPFHVDKARVLNGSGQEYVPYGINLVGLAKPYKLTDPSDKALTNKRIEKHLAAHLQADKQQIDAAHDAWCINTVRLQISQDHLVVNEGYDRKSLGIDKRFLAAVKDEVAYARALGLVVVINLQTQNDADEAVQIMPTERSVKFWYRMLYEFRSDPNIIFDLFNEPRFTSINGEGPIVKWNNWRNGFTRNGVTYYGMQQLAERLRATRTKNLFWVEGPSTSMSLEGVRDYKLSNVDGIVYAEHHPPAPNNERTWDRTFGYLVKEKIAPVVVGEWAQYSAAHDGARACWTDAKTTVPKFLNYLKTNKIGLIAYKLTPGVLSDNSGDLTRGSQFGPNWGCRDSVQPSYGAGKMIQDWFHAQNR